MVDNAGNTLANARNIGTLSGTQTFSDFVGTADTNDYYRFSLASASNFSLVLSGLNGGDADIQLLNSSGSLIVSRTTGGTANETITNQPLQAGTYYVRVYPFSGNSNYNLSLSATPSTPPVPLETINASLQRDMLTGTTGQTTSFTFASLAHSIPVQYDQIINYEPLDRIQFSNKTYNTTLTSALQVNDLGGLATLAATADSMATNSAIAIQINPSLISTFISQLVPSGTPPSILQSLIPPTPGTFLAINDSTAGFDPQVDSLIFLRNFSPAVANPISIA